MSEYSRKITEIIDKMEIDVYGRGHIDGFDEAQKINQKAEYDRGFHDGKQQELEKLQSYTKNSYDQGQMDGYEKGIEEAWKFARYLSLKPCETLNQIYGGGIITAMNYGFEKAKKMYDEYIANEEAVEDNEIRVGDEVYRVDNVLYRGIVINIYREKTMIAKQRAVVLRLSGFPDSILIEDLRKTGKHIDKIEKLAKVMQESLLND